MSRRIIIRRGTLHVALSAPPASPAPGQEWRNTDGRDEKYRYTQPVPDWRGQQGPSGEQGGPLLYL